MEVRKSEEGTFRETDTGGATGLGAVAGVSTLHRWHLGGRPRGRTWRGDTGANTCGLSLGNEVRLELHFPSLCLVSAWHSA